MLDLHRETFKETASAHCCWSRWKRRAGRPEPGKHRRRQTIFYAKSNKACNGASITEVTP